VTVQQATLLAFNLNPKAFHLDKGLQEQLRDGELILISNLPNRDFFRPGEFKIAKGAANMVRLSEYAAWSLSLNWPIPAELATLAKKAPPPTDMTTSSESDLSPELGEAPQQYTVDPRGWIDRNKVMNSFQVGADDDASRTFWDNALERPPKWLESARMQRGKRGESSLWCPITVALCLLDRKRMDVRQLDSVIHRHFPELKDRWREETTDER
jgi:hypothetical protein